MKKASYILCAILLAGPQSLRAQFMEIHGLLEETYSHYQVNDNLSGFGKGVLDQAYRLDLGGNYGLPIIHSTDYGIHYDRRGQEATLVDFADPLAQETTAWRAKVSLGLPRTRRFMITPSVRGRVANQPVLTFPNQKSRQDEWGLSGKISLPWLPSYSADYRVLDVGIEETVVDSRKRRKEYSDRAILKKGPLTLEYRHHWHDSVDLLGNLPSSSAQDYALRGGLSDTTFRKWGLESYALHVNWLRWENNNGAYAEGGQGSGNLTLRSQSFGSKNFRNHFTLQESGSGSGTGEDLTVVHGVDLSSRLELQASSVENRLQWTGRQGSSAWSDQLTARKDWLGKELNSILTIKESLAPSGGIQAFRDQVSHHLQYRKGRWRLGSEQSYRARRQEDATQVQDLRLTGKGVWAPSSGLFFDLDMSHSEIRDFVRDDVRVHQDGSLRIQWVPLVGLSTSLKYWLNRQGAQGLMSQSVEARADYVPDRHWRVTGQVQWNLRDQAVVHVDRPRTNYVNAELGIGYHIGKTDINLGYRYNESEYRNGYHRLQASLRRSI